MAFIIIKLVYGIYFGGIAFYLLFLISNLLFSGSKLINKLKMLIKGVAISPIWPMLIFSPKGRTKLFKIIKKF